jgi:hypothetical protein
MGIKTVDIYTSFLPSPKKTASRGNCNAKVVNKIFTFCAFIYNGLK